MKWIIIYEELLLWRREGTKGCFISLSIKIIIILEWVCYVFLAIIFPKIVSELKAESEPEPKATCEVAAEQICLQKVSACLSLQKVFPVRLQSEACAPQSLHVLPQEPFSLAAFIMFI